MMRGTHYARLARFTALVGIVACISLNTYAQTLTWIESTVNAQSPSISLDSQGQPVVTFRAGSFSPEIVIWTPNCRRTITFGSGYLPTSTPRIPAEYPAEMLASFRGQSAPVMLYRNNSSSSCGYESLWKNLCVHAYDASRDPIPYLVAVSIRGGSAVARMSDSNRWITDRVFHPYNAGETGCYDVPFFVSDVHDSFPIAVGELWWTAKVYENARVYDLPHPAQGDWRSFANVYAYVSNHHTIYGLAAEIAGNGDVEQQLIVKWEGSAGRYSLHEIAHFPDRQIFAFTLYASPREPTVFVGFAKDYRNSSYYPFLFRENVDNGVHNLNNLLANQLQSGEVLAEVTGISVDNRYVVGYGFRNNQPWVFIIDLFCQTHCGDVNSDRRVDDADLLQVLFSFGSTGSGLGRVDVNCDERVDDADLLQILFNFGSECE